MRAIESVVECTVNGKECEESFLCEEECRPFSKTSHSRWLEARPKNDLPAL